ncbi:MAG: DUF6338 family protein [Myxococcota bacterium]
MPSSAEPDPISTWVVINAERPTEWALVVLDDGTRYLGWISNWTFDPDAPNFDFLLKSAKRVDEHLNIQRVIDGRGVYVRSEKLHHIEFFAGST